MGPRCSSAVSAWTLFCLFVFTFLFTPGRNISCVSRGVSLLYLMILESFRLMLPIIILAGGGFLLSRVHSLSSESLVKVILDLLMPMLIFHALYTGDVPLSEAAGLAGSVLFVVTFLTLLSLLYVRMSRTVSAGDFIPSVIFMNSGFLGIPLMTLWGGSRAMNLVVIYDEVQTFCIFTLGVFLVVGSVKGQGLKSLLKTPILWAIVLGFAFRFLGLRVPDALLTSLHFGGQAAAPLAAFVVGLSLGTLKFHFSPHVVPALFFRFFGGFLAGWLSCMLFNLSGLSRTVVLVASSMPSAVLVSILPLRYGKSADFGSAMVVLSTLLSVLTVPLAFHAAALAGG